MMIEPAVTVLFGLTALVCIGVIIKAGAEGWHGWRRAQAALARKQQHSLATVTIIELRVSRSYQRNRPAHFPARTAPRPLAVRKRSPLPVAA